MITQLNPMQLAIICDWPTNRAIMYFHRIDYPDIEAHTVVYEKSELKKWYKDVSELEATVKLPLRKMIDDVQANFTSNKQCMEYVYKIIVNKIVPSKKTGLLPLSVSIPEDVSFLITPEQRQQIIERANEYLPTHIQENMAKYNIKIK